MSKQDSLKDYAKSLNKKASNLTINEIDKFLGKDVFQDFFDYLESEKNLSIRKTSKPKPTDPNEPVDMRWLAEGKEDPHSAYTKLTRNRLSMSDVSDDELANMVYMNIEVDRERDMLNILSGKPSSISILTAVKERIRWLTRQLAIAEGRYVPENHGE